VPERIPTGSTLISAVIILIDYSRRENI